MSASEVSASEADALVQVHKGNPTDEEIAAIVAVVTAAVSQAPDEVPTQPRDAWGRDTSQGRGGSPNVPWTYPNVSHLNW